MTPERKEQLLTLIAESKTKLANTRRDYSLAISPIYGLAELEDAELGNLAYLLWHGEYGCARGDVKGLLDLFELWVSKQ